MRDIIEVYIRSLAEREEGGDAPEFRQDLGTFLAWLLDLHGYTVLLQTFKHDGALRRKSAGRMQWGVDLIACKPDSDGGLHAYLFVLKQGDIGRREWTGAPGSLDSDLFLAAELPHANLRQLTAEGTDFTKVSIVAVHNGDLDTESIGPQVDGVRQTIFKRHGIQVDWWDAARLVELATTAPKESAAETPNAALFPPAVRPYIRMAIDSLRLGVNGSNFDLSTIDRLLKIILPGAKAAEDGTVIIEKDGNTPAILRFYRQASELALFVSLLESECVRVASGTTIPILDSLERIFCSLLERISYLPPTEKAQLLDKASLHKSKKLTGSRDHAYRIVELLVWFQERYIRAASLLRTRLTGLLSFQYGLAIAAPSERVDYPNRCLRFSGYLALAGLLSKDLGELGVSADMAQALINLWDQNTGGVMNPITDDQIIEIGLTFLLWDALDMNDMSGKFAKVLLERTIERYEYGRPLPAITIRSHPTLSIEEQRLILEVHFYGIEDAPAVFEDNASTILALVIYIASRQRLAISDSQIEVFDGRTQDKTKPERRRIHIQSWRPADSAPSQWFSQDISRQGTSVVYDRSAWDFRGTKTSNSRVEILTSKFIEYNKTPLEPSVADYLGWPSLNGMAWKRWRCPPPMVLFIPQNQRATKQAVAPDDETTPKAEAKVDAKVDKKSRKPRASKGGA